MISCAPEVWREAHFIGPVQWSAWKNLGWTKISMDLTIRVLAIILEKI
jgi:hypothetical protein